MLLSIRAAAAHGPKTGIPAATSASATPAASGASGPDDDEVRPRGAGGGDHGGRIGRVDAAVDAHARDGRDPGAPGHGDDRLDARLAGQPPGQGVLPAAAADEEDAARDGGRRAHRGRRPRRSAAPARPAPSGRSWRTTVWVRSGPTETSRIGTPASASSALT